MADKPSSFNEAYQKLHKAYVTRLENSIQAIDNILNQQQMGPLKKDVLERAMQLAHGLAGSGSTFGFPEVSKAGKKIDVFLEKILAALPVGGTISDSDFNEFEKMMYELQQTCEMELQNAPKTPAISQDNTPAKGSQDFFVLVVDDDENLSGFVHEKLRAKGIRSVVAPDGQKALDIIYKEIPDLIILDIMMPGISGHELLQRLKQDSQFLRIPIIMLTGQADQKDVASALHAGAIDYVIKPVDIDELVTKVKKILDASRYEILVADNDTLLLQLMGNWYREKGFRVKLVEDGKKAWDYIVSHAPDLVVLDRMMPGLEGLSILKNMRQEDATQDIPVIILSARKQEHDVAEALKRGAQDYLGKPFIPDDLIERSYKLLKKGG
jgi:DNA-binding response OmpR family regulator/HPt (histidine-containing phosphotransfer) domain-containing protein